MLVNNTVSMSKKQQILQTAVFSLLGELLFPLRKTDASPVNNIRISISAITTDMGASYAGMPSDVEAFPDIRCTEGMEVGDNGLFNPAYLSDVVTIAENTIACDDSAAQCPSGWDCTFTLSSDIGVCTNPNEEKKALPNPEAPNDLQTFFLNDTDWSGAVLDIAEIISNKESVIVYSTSLCST